jgi:methylmalonyl-CoA mutase N-terminal domain/subunit
VNRFRDEGATPPVSVHRADPALAARQVARLAVVRRTRDGARVAATLAALRDGARGKDTLMPLLGEAVRAYASVGEIAGVLREVWGMFREPAVV